MPEKMKGYTISHLRPLQESVPIGKESLEKSGVLRFIEPRAGAE